MTTKTLKLSQEDFSKLGHYETSIQHWSNEYTILVLRSKKALDGIDSLYVSRQKLLDDLIASSGVDLKKVRDANITPEGELQINIED